MENERQLLLEQLLKLENIVRKNPCGMSDITYKALNAGLSALIGKEFHTDMSLEQVARYFGVTTRTINLWQHKYNFPKGKQIGHHELSFSAEDVLEWQETHKSVFA